MCIASVRQLQSLMIIENSFSLSVSVARSWLEWTALKSLHNAQATLHNTQRKNSTTPGYMTSSSQRGSYQLALKQIPTTEKRTTRHCINHVKRQSLISQPIGGCRGRRKKIAKICHGTAQRRRTICSFTAWSGTEGNNDWHIKSQHGTLKNSHDMAKQNTEQSSPRKVCSALRSMSRRLHNNCSAACVCACAIHSDEDRFRQAIWLSLTPWWNRLQAQSTCALLLQAATEWRHNPVKLLLVNLSFFMCPICCSEFCKLSDWFIDWERWSLNT